MEFLSEYSTSYQGIGGFLSETLFKTACSQIAALKINK